MDQQDSANDGSKDESHDEPNAVLVASVSDTTDTRIDAMLAFETGYDRRGVEVAMRRSQFPHQTVRRRCS